MLSLCFAISREVKIWNSRAESIITTPKTKNGIREIPMLNDVRETLQELYDRRFDFNANNQVVVDGYTNFIFRDLYGNVYNNRRINGMLKRLIRDYNLQEDELAEKEQREPVHLPQITCHNLRHTFCSRLILAGTNIKTLQLLMGHAHAETTIRVYANVTKQNNQEEIAALEGKLKLR